MSRHFETGEDALEFISDALPLESWVEGKTLTVVIADENGDLHFAKLTLRAVLDKMSRADLRGTPE